MGETDESAGPIISRMHSLCMAVKAVNDGGDFDGDIKPGSPVVSPGGVWRSVFGVRCSVFGVRCSRPRGGLHRYVFVCKPCAIPSTISI